MTARLDRLCRDLFLLSHTRIERRPRGLQWERCVADHVRELGMPAETHPGGFTFLGRASLSGLRHQVDAAIACTDALVIGEWKAHRGSVPKNELLRFKAVSDDYYLALGAHVPAQPIVRVFGGSGSTSIELRRYAAHNGIVLIDRERWPSPVLASGRLRWPDCLEPDRLERRQLAWLGRPLQRVLARLEDGSYRLRQPPTQASVSSALAAHDKWSQELWHQVDVTPGRFEDLVVSTSQGAQP